MSDMKVPCDVQIGADDVNRYPLVNPDTRCTLESGHAGMHSNMLSGVFIMWGGERHEPDSPPPKPEG
jgi:hypothetical protein